MSPWNAKIELCLALRSTGYSDNFYHQGWPIWSGFVTAGAPSSGHARRGRESGEPDAAGGLCGITSLADPWEGQAPQSPNLRPGGPARVSRPAARPLPRLPAPAAAPTPWRPRKSPRREASGAPNQRLGVSAFLRGGARTYVTKRRQRPSPPEVLGVAGLQGRTCKSGTTTALGGGFRPASKGVAELFLRGPGFVM